MIASGFGIAAQLPYLKKLMHGYNSCKARTRRVHLVWKLQSLSLATAIEELLNAALVDDTLDDGYILMISTYIEDLHKIDNLSPRATVIKGSPDLKKIIQDEAEGKYIKRVQKEAKRRETMLVLVSASSQLGKETRQIIRNYVNDRIEVKELDYQLHD
ncbi:hypothetical protein FPOA_06950 [Fusarium poae]|uniref:Ferric reductase NAD binding domain-containing protein n=1 Tax=Fusarium poae TaxID=36050 RepID=A0A1B8AJF8_FUSPO|nr:hypothetical protein FPOA_06950 [Fusarium poae]